VFTRVLSLERKRSERSRQRFVLMLVHIGRPLQNGRGDTVRGVIAETLARSTRETDSRGWYQQDGVIGIICTEVGAGDLASIVNALHSRISGAFRQRLKLEQMNEIHISFHVFPEDRKLDLDQPADRRLYPDLAAPDNKARLSQATKRAIDIVGSLAALTLVSPLLVIIAVAVKLTSRGPVLFRQQRIGRYGIPFTFLKFRSMHHRADAAIHRNYVTRLISGEHNSQGVEGDGALYKIKNDPRVTSVGKILRKTSLDELPQFLNVLLGQMSLVGPRPPISYEAESYDVWHRRRFLEVKPGITGLWQVEGRSRVKFDEMVRLDLRYAKRWSPWLDIKILLRTPGAVLRGDGAY